MKSIEDLTAVDVSKYIEQLNPNPCQLCNSKQHPTVLVDNSPERKLVFTELKALDAWGTLNFELGTSPIIPLMCGNCGYISHIAIHPVLTFFNKEDV
ncbi:hypothetical protein [Aliivibrio logei]|uniref:hypothetical protein n=1 Tax=Aliivibrio logei TaxID=688 RepID=UPI00039B2572|nr:hypothetical protein [Aliivibrio logei]